MALKHSEISKKEASTKKHLISEIKDYLDLQYVFRRNTLTLEIEVSKLNENKYEVLDEAFLNSIWIDLQMDGFKCSDSFLMKILNFGQIQKN